jgi:hypothetical protein
MALIDWSLRQVDWFKCGGWGFPAGHFEASRLRPGVLS